MVQSYLQITEFFNQIIKKNSYDNIDQRTLLQMFKAYKSPTDILLILRNLNNCPDIFKDFKHPAVVYKAYLKICKNIKLTDEYEFMKFVPTDLYAIVINKLIHELDTPLNVEETGLLVNNINYILNIIYIRDDFDKLDCRKLTESEYQLRVLSVCILIDENRTNVLKAIMKIYKNSEFEYYLQDKLIQIEME